MKEIKNKIMVGINLTLILLVIIVTVSGVVNYQGHSMHHSTMDEMKHGEMSQMRDNFISQKNTITGEMLTKGMYRCCLEKLCTYCIEKTPGHGEGAECSCLEDVVNGVHPCGECIGEILEGHGNPYLAKYFATAIAEKTGQLEAIRLIIEEKYDISVEDQV